MFVYVKVIQEIFLYLLPTNATLDKNNLVPEYLHIQR